MEDEFINYLAEYFILDGDFLLILPSTTSEHSARDHHTIIFKNVTYPTNLSPQELSEYRNWWAPCASFRLFLPEILTNLQKVIYLDSDTLFLSNPKNLWDEFKNYNEYQVGGLAPRIGHDFLVPWSNENYILTEEKKMTQVNSGVFLMDLEKMRQNVFDGSSPTAKTAASASTSKLKWNKSLFFPLYNQYNHQMHGDQDLINIIFHYNPTLLYFLPCKYNYHHKFCFNSNESINFCSSAEKNGAFIIHGSAKTFNNNYAPAFRAVNEGFLGLNFLDVEKGVDQSDLDQKRETLIAKIKENLLKKEINEHPHCGGKFKVFTGNL